jgi:hypothetical protein
VLLLLATALAATVEVADATGPVTIDGRLDEASWAAAVPATEFTKFQPVDGGPPAGTTEVRFLQDDRYLYVGIRVTGVDYGVRARMSQRELINADDQIGLYLDTFHDGRTGYIFYTNALGIQQDIRHNNGRWNVDWDTAYRSKGTVTDDGYELELAFPWRSLRYPAPDADGEQTWGLLVTRKIPSEGAKYGFPTLTRGHPRLFQQGAELTGVRPGSRGTGLELMPALTTSSTTPREEQPAPLEVVRPSLDARYAITPDIGAAATVNPDFSQVESDVRDVRLNARFAYQFPERRPFFLDGIDAYQDRQNTLYTRSIDQPLYGLKVSGRDRGVSVGLVHALDQSPLPSFHEAGAPGFGADDVEGRWAANTMGRLQLDAFGAGYVGVTFADKRLVGGPGASGAAGHFDVGGVDMAVPLSERWIAAWSTAHSVTGQTGGEQLWGQQTEASLQRASGVGTGMSLSLTDRTPGYRNEMGFTTQSALTHASGSVDHTFTPGSAIDTVVPALTAQVLQERNDDRDRYVEAGGSTSVLVQGIHQFGVSGGVVEVQERTVSSPGAYATLGYSGQIGPWIEWTPEVRVARGFDYALLVPADDQTAALELTVRAGGLRIDGTTRFDRHVPVGSEAQRATFTRSRLGYQFTRTLGLRLVVEHTTGTELDYDALRSSLLLTWLDVPGTAAFLGVSEDDAIDGGLRLVERTVFAKVSVLLRP